MQAYSDPRRENDPHALPDLEVWEIRASDPIDVREYSREDGETEILSAGWYYWFCFPGCMPDSDLSGPFDSYDAALADAREGNESDEDEDHIAGGEGTTLKVSRAMLVYQAGIANVFAVAAFNLTPYGREQRRLMQSSFRACEYFARGLAAAGVVVRSAACNMAGDIAGQTWSDNLDEQPFSDNFRPVSEN